MADTAIRHDSTMNPMIWSATLYREAMKRLYFGKYVGTSPDSIIQKKVDLKTKKGDKIHFDLMMELTGGGKLDDETMEGNEEALQFYDWAITVHKRKHAVRPAGEMTERRTMYDLRTCARSALANWMKNMIDNDTVLALSGLRNKWIKDDDGNIVAAVSPSLNRKWIGGQTKSGVLTRVDYHKDLTNTDKPHLFGTQVISAVKRMAQMANPIIRPVFVEEMKKDYYVMFVHPYQVKALKAETDWIAAQKDASERGVKNPLFSGALGVWDGVVIQEYERIITRKGEGGSAASEGFEAVTNANNKLASGVYAARALFCGAQAGVHAIAREPDWTEDQFDYKQKWGVMTSLVYAAGKTRFNNEDFGVITVDTVIEPDKPITIADGSL